MIEVFKDNRPVAKILRNRPAVRTTWQTSWFLKLGAVDIQAAADGRQAPVNGSRLNPSFWGCTPSSPCRGREA